ncbi:MAG: type II secretion system ATPase GspE [Nitrospirae bacterium]|nr:type II secretion system ATPase GspE [Nitrospirota bacterium]
MTKYKTQQDNGVKGTGPLADGSEGAGATCSDRRQSLPSLDQDGIEEGSLDLALLREVSLTYARGNMMLPVRREGDTLKAFVCGNQGIFALHELARTMGLKPVAIKVQEGRLLELINHAYGMIGSAAEVMSDIAEGDFDSVARTFQSPRDILELTEDAPIIRLLNALLQQAVKENASDIHIEPYEKELIVRLRIDGMLRKILTPPKIIQEALISRIKIMADLDIAEKRLPQDGRIRLLVGSKDVDVRVSIIPSSFGERAVLRLLDRKRGLIGLDQLGMSEQCQRSLNHMLRSPHGIILVTGPTGSGKTTTLYAALNSIYSDEKNIITIEDPVEYQMKGIGQINVNHKIGLTFAAGLRSILRHDPDIIMVGEIRDLETAEIAIQASLTGHLVFSTLHTNDAASAITRLVDMGVEPFLIASSIVGVLAQRLLRKVCMSCMQKYTPSSVERDYFSTDVTQPKMLSRGVGCDKCNHTGYSGRIGIFEILTIDGEVVSLIDKNVDYTRIKTHAVNTGMTTLRADGLSKAAEGITTLEEVLRVTQKDHADISI